MALNFQYGTVEKKKGIHTKQWHRKNVFIRLPLVVHLLILPSYSVRSILHFHTFVQFHIPLALFPLSSLLRSRSISRRNFNCLCAVCYLVVLPLSCASFHSISFHSKIITMCRINQQQ